ncbi:MAG: hypothetical protein H6698_08115 [Myxococcales bacterium]|nr:hypothetical protein [Myxococcales bacterium]MCB9534253.1 hypothetical protein [Myxococcales bacterium]
MKRDLNQILRSNQEREATIHRRARMIAAVAVTPIAAWILHAPARPGFQSTQIPRGAISSVIAALFLLGGLVYTIASVWMSREK